MEKARKRVAIWGIIAMAIITTALALSFSAPTKALAATDGLQAGTTTVLTTQAATAKKAKSVNPYIDVNKYTVDAKGIAAVKYVKAHKGYTGVINGKRFYPTRVFTEAQFTKILRNLYGNGVALSKSKKAVTAKYACARLQATAKSVFGVKIKWKSGNGSAKLTRVGCSSYIKAFATWDHGLFKPKQ